MKRHLGLDDARSRIVIDELNEFVWPGFDVLPIPPSRDRFAYGFLPPRLFDRPMANLAQVRTGSRAQPTPRD